MLNDESSVLLLRLAIAERHQGIARDQVGIAFHPLVLVVDPAAVGLLPLGEGLGDVGAPVVLFTVGVHDLVDAQSVQALGHGVVVIIEAAMGVDLGHAGVGVHGVMFLNPLVSFLDARIVLGDAAIDHALDAGIGHAPVA